MNLLVRAVRDAVEAPGSGVSPVLATSIIRNVYAVEALFVCQKAAAADAFGQLRALQHRIRAGCRPILRELLMTVEGADDAGRQEVRDAALDAAVERIVNLY